MRNYKNILKTGAIATMICMSLVATGCGQVGAGDEPTGGRVVNTPSGGTSQSVGNNASSTSADISNTTISSMAIAFYDGYNRATAEAINSYGDITLPEYVITMTDEQIEVMQEALSKATEYVDDHSYECNCEEVLLDYYKIVINDEMVLYCGNDSKVWMQEPYAIYEAEELSRKVVNVAMDYMKENVYISPFGCGVDFIIHNGSSIEVTDEVMSNLNKYSFSKVEIDTDFNEYGNIVDVITLSDGNVLLVYSDMSNIGYLDGADYGYYVKIGSGSEYLNKYLENVYENQSNSLGALNSDSPVVITYNGVEYETDAELAKLINTQSMAIDYSQYNWLTPDYDFEDSVCVIIDNGFFRIPVDMTYGNRYYIAANGDVYMAWNFSGDVERRIFETVGIER